jgi:hypothetical protein
MRFVSSFPEAHTSRIQYKYYFSLLSLSVESSLLIRPDSLISLRMNNMHVNEYAGRIEKKRPWLDDRLYTHIHTYIIHYIYPSNLELVVGFSPALLTQVDLEEE